MDLLKDFLKDYANGVTALASLLTFVLALVTLLYLRREYANKYRPYVAALVETEPVANSAGFAVTVHVRDVGPHPCEFKLEDIHLQIGDETHDTPNIKEWLLVAQGVGVRYPIGHVNDQGIRKIREARYKTNRIEASFSLIARSAEKKFERRESLAYEILVGGDTPVVVSRPEWRKAE